MPSSLKALLREARAWHVAVFLLLVLALVLALHPRRTVDLGVYLRAGERVITGEPIYRDEDGAMPFKYAPPVALLFAPLSLLPRRLVAVAWDLGLIGALVLLRRVCAGTTFGATFGTTLPDDRRAVLATLALIQPIFLELFYGQVDLWLALALMAGAAGVSARQGATVATMGASGRAGALLALAVLFKPPAAAFGLWYARRGGHLVRVALAALLTLTLLGAAWAAWALRMGSNDALAGAFVAWSQKLGETTAPWMLGHNPQGLPTLLLQLFTADVTALPSEAAMARAELIAACMLLVPLLFVRPTPAALAALLCFAAAFLSPLCWRANLVMAWPLVYLALARDRLCRLSVLLVGLIGVLMNEALLGGERFRALMMWRPFTWALLALYVSVLLSERVASDARQSRAAALAGSPDSGRSGH